MPISSIPQDITVRSITIDDGNGPIDMASVLNQATLAGLGQQSAVGSLWNALQHGCSNNGEDDNSLALQELITEVAGAGGGTIYLPSGDYRVAIRYNGSLSPANRSVYLQDIGPANVVLLGDGPSTRIVWGGDAGQGGGGGGAAHCFYIRGQTSHITFANLKILQGDLTNPDPGAEQHHLIRLHADRVGNTSHIRILNCDFGLVKGDAVNCSGGFGTTRIKSGVLGSSGSGSVGGLSDTTPAGLLPGEGMRPCVEFSADWDGGGFTFTGTEPNGRVISETVVKQNAVGADTVAATRDFAAITEVSKTSGGTTGTANLGWTYVVAHVDIDRCRFNGFDRAGDHPGYGYRSAVGVQRLSEYIRVTNCFMTGSDDQLIDFEPTGNGPLGPWTIERNTIVPLAVAEAGGADTCCSFFGNANKFPCVRSSISHNLLIGGGLIGGKLVACDIVGNYLWVPEDARLLMQFTDRMEDVRILDNWVEAIATGVGDVTAPCISLVGGGSATVPDHPEAVLIERNHLHWACLEDPNQQPAIRITAGSNCVVRGNTLVNHGTAVAVDVAAIKVEDSAVDVVNFRVEGNTIQGNAGGGSIQRGIDIVTRPTQDWTNLSISGNLGTGVTATGVNVRDPNGGSYANSPSLLGNRFHGATNQLVLGTGVTALIGGNGSTSCGQYTGAGDPASESELDSVGSGSTYHRTNGTVYIKTGAGAAGWKAITTAS